MYILFSGVSVHVSNAAPKSEVRPPYRDGRSGGHGPNRGNGPEGPMYQQRYNGPTPNAWANQSGPRGYIFFYKKFIQVSYLDTVKGTGCQIMRE